MKEDSEELDACGCCGDDEKAFRNGNPPGREALNYRMKVHSSFFKDMVSRLSERQAPYENGKEASPLSNLCTRKRDDPTIALLDAWAAVGDVLTFYQERICNEGFIRTAKEHRSVVELARSMGYELSPGSAASTCLSFVVEDTEGAPDQVTVPKGTKVESVPGPGELPQVFETVSEFTARSDWNEIRPRLSRPQPLDPQAPQVYIQGLDSNIKAGDFILFVDSNGKVQATAKRVMSVVQDAKLNRTDIYLEKDEKIKPKEMSVGIPEERNTKEISEISERDSWEKMDLNQDNVRKVLMSGKAWTESMLAAKLSLAGWDSVPVFRHLQKIKDRPEVEREEVGQRDSAAGIRTRGLAESLPGEGELSGGQPSNVLPGLYVFKERVSPFGHNAPRWDSLPDNLKFRAFYGPKPPYPKSWDGPDEPSITTDSQQVDYPDAHFFLERSLPEVVPGDWMLIVGKAEEELPVDSLKGTFQADLSGKDMDVRLTGTIEDASGTTKAIVDAAATGIVRGKAEGRLEGTLYGVFKAKEETEKGEGSGVGSGEEKEEWDRIQEGDQGSTKSAIKDVVAEAYRAIGTVERTVADYSMTAKATGVLLSCPDGKDARDRLKKFKVRNTTMLAVSRSLPLAPIPIDDPIDKGADSLECNGIVRNLHKDQLLVISGERQDLEGVTAWEVVALSREAEHMDGITTIYFQPALENPYKRETMTINANVVYADHGDTSREVLGSGIGSASNQEFLLKKKPLTYVSASTPAGRKAEIKVEVDSVEWTESSSFLDDDDIRETYIIRIDHDHTAHIIFGDGEKGARLPTGLENVVVEYRTGIGKAGMLAAGKLTLLKNRPQGIRAVTNPLPATGGEEPEDIEQARKSALLQALHVDRIVSLSDYENFALNYPGIGKARAMILRMGQKKLVHMTVATKLAADRAEVDGLARHTLESTSKLYTDLVFAIRSAGDPTIAFMVDTYEPRFFNLSAIVQIKPQYKKEIVFQEIQERLESAFSFYQRDFSQPAASSEVIGIIQGIEGVAAVKIDEFYRLDETPSYRPVIEAAGVLVEEDDRGKAPEVRKADLLLINPRGIELEEKTVVIEK